MAQQLTDEMLDAGRADAGVPIAASADAAPETPRLRALGDAATEPVELPADRSSALLKLLVLGALLAVVAATMLRRRR